MSIRTFLRDAVDVADRMSAGAAIAYPAPMVYTAIGSTTSWALLGYAWPVAVSGLVLTCAVRLRLDPARWGEGSEMHARALRYYAQRDAARRSPALVEASRD